MLKMTGEDKKYSARGTVFYCETRFMNFFNNTLMVDIRGLPRRYGGKIWRFHVQPSY